LQDVEHWVAGEGSRQIIALRTRLGLNFLL
jgi:hypothetical protein